MSEYTPGSHKSIALMHIAMKLLIHERDLAYEILSQQFSTVWREIVEPVLVIIAETFEQTERHIHDQCAGNPARMLSSGFFVIVDTFYALTTAIDQIDGITRIDVGKCSPFMKRIDEAVKVLRDRQIEFIRFFLSVLSLDGTVLSSFTDDRGATKIPIPKDGSIFEVIVFAVSFLKRSMTYRPALEIVLTHMFVADRDESSLQYKFSSPMGNFIRLLFR